jgi:hypothetical protein
MFDSLFALLIGFFLGKYLGNFISKHFWVVVGNLTTKCNEKNKV